jgi:hypothetical protein
VTSLQVACKGLADNIDGALFCGVIEVETGNVLALHSTGGHSPEFELAFKLSCQDLLRSPTIALFDAATAKDASQTSLSEVQLISANTCHLAKALGDGTRALVLVARKNANVGLSWAEVKVTAALLDRGG